MYCDGQLLLQFLYFYKNSFSCFRITCEVIAGRIAEESKQNSNKKLLSTKILSEAQDQIKSKSKSNSSETAEQSS